MSELRIDDIPLAIRQVKAKLRAALPDYAQVFRAVETRMQQQIATLQQQQAAGQHPVPQLAADDIIHNRVSEAQKALIRQRGCCVINAVFPRAQAERWNQQIGAYLEENHFTACLQQAAPDHYFGDLKASKPQIYGIYWSRPQAEARQAATMRAVQVFLNRLWNPGEASAMPFAADRIVSYADRIRRRPPHANSLGLSPHVDGGSIERWLDDNFRYVYRHIFSGAWQQYDPFAAAGRPQVREIASPAVCSMFRTFQGWTALTPQRKNGGTLQLLPVSNAMAYLLLRALQDDVPDDDLCGAAPGRALPVSEKWHPLLLSGICSIPDMEPGDTVFWHCDVVHAVENEHQGESDSNVMYIAAAPDCEKNRAYLQKQWLAFEQGRSPTDYAADDFEVDFTGRATPADLTAEGRRQMGG